MDPKLKISRRPVKNIITVSMKYFVFRKTSLFEFINRFYLEVAEY